MLPVSFHKKFRVPKMEVGFPLYGCFGGWVSLIHFRYLKFWAIIWPYFGCASSESVRCCTVSARICPSAGSGSGSVADAQTCMGSLALRILVVTSESCNVLGD